MKKYLNYKNLIIVLIVGLIANNVLLQIKVEKAIDAANDAAYYAEEASSNAKEASNNAENAYYSAQKAANNSFGNQCYTCP